MTPARKSSAPKVVVGAIIVLWLFLLAACSGYPGDRRVPLTAGGIPAQTPESSRPGKISSDHYLLPNGWSISPAGRQIPLGGLPLKGISVPDQPLVIVASTGYTEHFLAVINIDNEEVVQRVPIKEGWMGVAIDPAGKTVYASAGSEDRILVYRLSAGRLEFQHDIQMEAGSFPAGLAVNADGTRLYITANTANALKIADVAQRKIVRTIPVGIKPYSCILSADGKRAWVSNWGEDTVSVIDLAHAYTFKAIKVREKPNDLLFDAEGARVFVANGNRNTVSVIDANKNEVVEEIEVCMTPDAHLGTTPNALAFSPDQKTLYVANADNNALAVIDISKPGTSSAKGFVPTGWYPSAVVAVGNKLVVANGKGVASQPKSLYKPGVKNSGHVGRLLEGTISFIDRPDPAELADYSLQVYRNSPYHTKREGLAPPPFALGQDSPIKYVFYIIKENRTYDCIFGDMKEGNGDPAYCLFPELVTPNHHALAREFVLFDNLYHDAEVSMDGHHWVTSAYATDYVEKFWPATYAGKGRGARLDMHDDPVAFSAGGFIWDLCKAAGVSYRSYGEGARIRFAKPGTLRPATPSLEGHIHPTYIGSDGVQVMSDRKRYELWREEFRQFEMKGEMPRFTVLSLPGDHLLGTRPGVQTPSAMMAENDLAMGKIIDALSHSRFWRQMAIFVVEDDTQGGPDHVDVHRAPAMIASPYAKRGKVDSTMYSTSSVLRTMELILGLPPMTQYDAAAVPMWEAFQSKPDFRPYLARPANIDLEEKNPVTAYGAQRSIELTLEVADTSDDREYNEIIWKSVRGAGSELPPRKVATFVKSKH